MQKELMILFAIIFLISYAGISCAAERIVFGHGAEFYLKNDASSGGVKRSSIFAHPPWKDEFKGQVACEYAVHLNAAKKPVLKFYIGLQDNHGSNEGLIYRVRVGDEEIWQAFCHKSGWVPVSIDLSKYAGKAIALELSVESRGEFWANWAEPRVVDGEETLYDLGEMAWTADKYLLPATDVKMEYSEDKEAKAKALPTSEQLTWQKDKFIGFIHFGMNTYVGNTDWGDGTASPTEFLPQNLDATQWVKVMKDSGMKMAIITAKHHDGFCLWPSRVTDYSVKQSRWKNGKGDVVGEVADACRKAGIKLGIYLSPWDRNCNLYGTSEYNEFFKSQLRELLTGYGDVAEVWFDGACGEGPNGKKQVYDWPGYFKLIRELQPKALIAICGPDIRWVGNEDGLASETEWSTQLRNGNYVWYPAECDVSIRPSWFYRKSEDDKVKSPDQLLDIYFRSVGRNAVLLLNLPPDKRGLIHENDVKALRGLRSKLDSLFKTNLGSLAKASSTDSGLVATASCAIDGKPDTFWSPKDGQNTGSIELSWEQPINIKIISLREHIESGQRIEAFHIDYFGDNGWQKLAEATTVGSCRLLRVPATKTNKIRIVIDSSLASPMLEEIEVY